MTPRRKLSAVLLESERITAEDVERALAHQRTHGGYFGEALVDLGLVRREEIEWALASQLDLPFIFPDPDAADPQATRLVTPAWALAHLAVPIVHAGDSITVVVADPLSYETVEALKATTGLDVEMALATPTRIRELIRALYGGTENGRSRGEGTEAPSPPMALDDFLTEALARGADRIGVSARGTRARGWYTAGEWKEGRRLEDGWDGALEATIDPWPPPGEDGDGSGASWDATVRRPGGDVAVEARLLASLSGTELLLRPRRYGAAAPAPAGATMLPVGLRADLRLLATSGAARVGVAGPAAVVDGALPSLPSVVLGEEARSAHVTAGRDVPGVYTLVAEAGPGFAALLEAYAFDAVTVDLALDDARLAGVLGAAPLAFARVPGDAAAAALEEVGIGWLLTVVGSAADAEWDLRAVVR